MSDSFKKFLVLLNILMIVLSPLSPAIAASDAGNNNNAGGNSGNSNGGNSDSGNNAGGSGSTGGNSGNSGSEGNSGGNSGGNNEADNNGGGNNGNNGNSNGGGNKAGGNDGDGNEKGGNDKGNNGNGNGGNNGNGNNGENKGKNDHSGAVSYSNSNGENKQERKFSRETTLERVKIKNNKAKEHNSSNKSQDNLKNFFLEIPLTDETPYNLKQQAYARIKSLLGQGEDNHKLGTIADLMNQSFNESFWLDERHVISSEVFKYDMHAAQQVRVLIDREKKSPLLTDDLTYIILKLIQADKMLAYIGIEDTKSIIEKLPGGDIELEFHLDRAISHFLIAEALLERGSDVVAVQHYNNAWNESFGYLVTKDALSPPRITIERPADNSYTNSSNQIVAGTVFDVMVSAIKNVNITTDGNTSSAPVINGTFEGVAALKEGHNVIEASAADYFGNVGSARVNVTLDTIPPEINITGIGEGAYYNYNVSAAVEFSDIHLNTTVVLLDGNPYSQSTNISSEGNHTLTAQAADLAGNTATKSAAFTIDRTPPDVKIFQPANAGFVRQVVNIKGEAKDLNPDAVTIKIDEIKVSESLDYNWDTRAYPDGSHTITLEANDKAGNSASTSINVTVDNTEPEVIIKSPLNFYLGKNITVDADVIEANFESWSVRVDGKEVSTTLSYELNTAIYADGNHTIEIYAFDKAGNTGAKGALVNFDNTAPDINMTSPHDGAFVKHAVDIDGIVNDTNLLSYTIAIDGSVVSNTLPHLWDTFAYSDGEHIINISAADKAGNTASKEITLTIDNTLPRVEIKFPPDRAFVRGVVDLTVDVFDAYIDKFRIYINGVLAAENQANFSWNTTQQPDGAYIIELVAYDKVGNEKRTSINVTVDNTPPQLAVSELNLYPTLNNSEYPLLITTEADINTIVNSVPVILDNGSATYKTNVTLGINNFVVTAIDRAGNPSVWNKTILVDEDNLPDWYETNVTGTDPLNADSDSTKTASNEAANGITDDREDFDNDGLTNLQEFRLGTNPFSNDTDNDGLTDEFEVFKTGTFPTSNDSDGDGITDANEDLDNDGLTNLQEQSLGTDPLNSDTDDDTLNDGYEVNTLKTNPLSKDTDNDGLEDDSEVKLGTNPLLADSDGDGKPDGNESYVQTFANTTAGVEATINGIGDIGKNIVLAKDSSAVLVSSLPGVVNTVDISSSSQVNSVSIKVYYNEANLGGIQESELKLFYYNETSNVFELVADQGINTAENYVWGSTNHLSIFGIATPRDWFNQWYVNWKKPEQVFKIGDRMRIKANVHNTGQGSASNVKVEFRENTQSGTLISSTTIPSIAAGSSALTSIEWTVRSGVTQVCVNVDPANLIAEVSEGNNNACGDFSRNLDSDNDDLTDYEETNGMRVAFPNAFVRTYAGNAHSDNDGLTDGYEMGRIVYDPGNKLLYDSLATLYGWDKSLYDGYHYEYKADPMKTDTDDDGFNDKQELDAGTNPFKSDDKKAVEFTLGFTFGEILYGTHDSLYYMGGWVLSGFSSQPITFWWADIRDSLYSAVTLDVPGFLVNVLGVGPVAGDAAKALGNIGKFAAKHAEKVSDIAKFVLKNFPGDGAFRIDAYDRLYDFAASALKRKGISTSRVDELVDKGIDLSRHNKAVDLLKSWWGKRAIRGADDVAEILGDEIIKAKYPTSQGYVVKYKVTFYDSLGGTAKEVDTVVINNEGKLIAFGETKSKKTLTSFEDAETQITDTKRLIVNKAFSRIKAGDGSEIDVSKVHMDYIQETFKIGPADAEHAYEHKLAEKSTELDEIYKTFSAVK